MNNLPKYWVVENTDQSQLFKDVVISYIHKTYGHQYKGNTYAYYGYDGRLGDGGCFCNSNINNFQNIFIKIFMIFIIIHFTITVKFR